MHIAVSFVCQIQFLEIVQPSCLNNSGALEKRSSQFCNNFFYSVFLSLYCYSVENLVSLMLRIFMLYAHATALRTVLYLPGLQTRRYLIPLLKV